MNVNKHILYGALFTIILYFLLPEINTINLLLIWFSSVLIDFDHYIYYMYKKKDFNLKNAYKFFKLKQDKFRLLPKEKREEFYGGIFFLHSLEVLIILFIIGLYFESIFFIFIGFGFHLILDLIHNVVFYKRRMDKLSLIHDMRKFKKLKFIGDYLD